jgi:hypothetical protein
MNERARPGLSGWAKQRVKLKLGEESVLDLVKAHYRRFRD